MIVTVKDSEGPILICPQENIEAVSQLQDKKGAESCIVFFKSGSTVEYNLPMELVAKQIWE